MLGRLRRSLQVLPYITLAVIMVLGTMISVFNTPEIPSVYAAVDTYTVAGGAPGSLPTVGAAAISLPTITITEDGAGDDFVDNEVIRVAIDTTNYDGVQFDNTIAFGALTIGGSCGYTAATAATYSSEDQIVDITIDDTVGNDGCAAAEDITIGGLQLVTRFAQAAPGAFGLVSVDNTTTSAGTAITTSSTINLAIAAADAAATINYANAEVGATQNTTLGLTLPRDLANTDTVVFTLPTNVSASGVAFVSETFAGAGTFTCANAGNAITCTATGAITAGTGNIVFSGVSAQFAATGQQSTDLAVNDVVNGSGADIAADATVAATDTTAHDAAATLTLADAAVGATQNTTLGLTINRDLANTDTITFTLPNNVTASGVAYVSDTFAGAGAFTCANVGNAITCTATGAITAGTGNIVFSGVTGAFAATGQQSTDLAVNDVAAGAGNDIATDTTVALTNTTAHDAAATLTLADGAVGATQNTTLGLTINRDLANTDTITFTLPNNVSASGVAFVSDTFAGAGAFTCANVGNAITCTATGAITAGTGNIVFSGVSGQFAATGQQSTDLAVNDVAVGAGNDIATDSTVALTNTTAADAAATITYANPVVGSTQNTTLGLTLPRDLANTDTVVFTLPTNVSASGVAFVSETFAGAGTFTCANVGNAITCTATGAITAGTGNIVFSGVTPIFAAAGQQSTDLAVNDVAVGAGNDIATDSTVAATDTTAADAAATITYANPIVGSTQNTTLGLTLPIDLANTDTVVFTLPTNVSASGVAFVSETFAGAGTFTCANTGNVITCTATGAITAGTGNIVFSGVTPIFVAAGQQSTDLAVNDVSNAGADIATDSTVAATDTGAAVSNVSAALANAAVGATQNTTFTLTIPVDLGNTDTAVFSLPSNISGTAVYVSDTFGGAGSFACSGSTTVTCTANGAITAGTGNIVVSGLTGQFAASGQTLGNTVTDTGNGTVAVDASGPITDTTAADAAATITYANAAVGATQNTTLGLTLPVDLANTDTVVFTLPTNVSASGVAFVSETFAGAGTFTCANAGNIITCTATGAITAGTGNIVFSGVTPIFVAAGQQSTDLAVNDVSNAGADIATDTTVAATDTTAADANASLALGTNSVVGTAGNSTLTITIPVDMGNTDTIAFTAPAKLNVAGVAFVSETFAGAGTFSACGAAGQIVTCTANGAITAGTGTIVMSGILSLYVDAGETISGVVVNDTGNGNTATDASGSVTATTAGALAATNVEPVSLSTNAAGSVNVTFTVVTAVPNNGRIVVTLPAGFTLDSGGATTATANNVINGTTYQGTAAGQVVTLTGDGAGTGIAAAGTVTNLTLSNIQNSNTAGSTGTYSIATQINAGNVIDQDTAVTADAIVEFITTATTGDNDGNGQIDRIVLALAEDVNGGTVTGADFTLNLGYAVAAASRTNASEITIVVTESGGADSGAVPTVTIAASITLASGGTVAAGSRASVDGAAPVALSATMNYNDNSRALAVTFSETINASATVAGGFHLNNITGTDVVTLTVATASGNGTVLTWILTEAERVAALAISGVAGGDGGAVVLDIDANSFFDLAGPPNGNAIDDNNAVTETADTKNPNLTQFDINLNTNSLTFTFDETVNVGTPFSIPAITLQDAATLTTSYTLVDSATASGNGTVIVVNIGAVDLAAINGNAGLLTGLANSFVTHTAGLVNDLPGNAVVAIADGAGLQANSYTIDATPPNVTSWTLDLDSTSPTLTLNFDEVVNAATLGATAITIQDAATAAQSFTLTGGTTASANGAQIVIDLTGGDRTAIVNNALLASSTLNAFLRTTNALIDDGAGNDNVAIADGAALQASGVTGLGGGSAAFRSRSTDTSSCSADPCLNGGICSNVVGGYTCSCPAGFSGVNCEVSTPVFSGGGGGGGGGGGTTSTRRSTTRTTTTTPTPTTTTTPSTKPAPLHRPLIVSDRDEKKKRLTEFNQLLGTDLKTIKRRAGLVDPGTIKSTNGEVMIEIKKINIIDNAEDEIPTPRIVRSADKVELFLASKSILLLRPVDISVTLNETDPQKIKILDADGNKINSFSLNSDGLLTFKTNVIKDFTIHYLKEAKTVTMFDDAKNDPEAEAIMALKKKDIIGGFPDGTFRGKEFVNRAQLSKMLAMIIGLYPDDPQAQDQWYSALKRSLDKSLITKGHIDPGTVEGRANFLALIAKAKGINILDLPCTKQHFDDVPTNVWYCGVVQYALEQGWIGKAGGNFNPAGFVDRSTAAGWLHRAFFKSTTQTTTKETAKQCDSNFVLFNGECSPCSDFCDGANSCTQDSTTSVVTCAEPAAVCEDSATFTFTLNSIDMEQSCEWLTKNSRRTDRRLAEYCEDPEIAKNCAASCNTCSAD